MRMTALLFVLGGAAQGVTAQEFVAQDAGFAVQFPGAPVRTERSLDTPDGPSRVITYQVELDGCLYLAQRVDSPAGLADSGAAGMLERQRQSLHKKNRDAGGSVVSELPVSLGQYPGLEIVQEPRPGIAARSRSFAVKRQMLTVAFTRRPGCDAAETAVSGFLGSLRLLP
jgi:hypothetical protein